MHWLVLTREYVEDSYMEIYLLNKAMSCYFKRESEWQQLVRFNAQINEDGVEGPDFINARLENGDINPKWNVGRDHCLFG